LSFCLEELPKKAKALSFPFSLTGMIPWFHYLDLLDILDLMINIKECKKETDRQTQTETEMHTGRYTHTRIHTGRLAD